MPVYSYQCADCLEQLVLSRPLDAPEHVPQCSVCGIPMKRTYNFGAVTFNGSGFYTTDK